MKTIINAVNLLGDSLYSLQPIKQYIDEKHKEGELLLVADRGLAFQMFLDTFPDMPLYDDLDKAIQSASSGEDVRIIKLSAGDSGHICFQSAQQTGKQLHISEGFAKMLGMELKGPIIPYAPWCNAEPQAVPPPVRIGISPFSKSCSRHSGEKPNKTLDDWKWMHLLTFFRLHCDEIRVIGGPKEVLTNCPISEDEKFCAKSFKDLRTMLKSLTVFVTVDNGLGHLASTLNVRTIIIWPQVSSMEFIAPLWAPNTQFIRMQEPPDLVKPAMLLPAFKFFVRKFLDEQGVAYGDASSPIPVG